MQRRNGVSIGETLARTRQDAGLSITQISQRTRIRETVIRGIENDDFPPCSGDFYARGHIRSVAKVAGVDADPLIREYDAAHGGIAARRACARCAPRGRDNRGGALNPAMAGQGSRRTRPATGEGPDAGRVPGSPRSARPAAATSAGMVPAPGSSRSAGPVPWPGPWQSAARAGGTEPGPPHSNSGRRAVRLRRAILDR